MYLGTEAAKAVSTIRVGAAPGGRQVPVMIYWLGTTSLLIDISGEMVASVLPVFMLTVLSLSPMLVGFLDGLFQGSASLIQLMAAQRADAARNHRRVAWIGYAMSAMARGLLIISMTMGALFAFAALMLDRIGKGVRTAPRDALIAAHANPSQMNAAFGVHRSMDAVGALVGPLIGAAILWSWSERFDILLGVSFVLSLLGVTVFGLRVRNATVSRADSDLAPTLGSKPVSRLRTLLCCTAYRSLLLVVGGLGLFTISDGMLFLVLQQQTQLAARGLPLVYAGSALVFVLAVLPLARAAHRWGARRIFLLGHLCLGMTYACLYTEFAGSEARAVTVAVLIGLCHAATDGVLVVMAIALIPRETLAVGLALIGTTSGIAKLVSSTLLGWLWQSASTAQAVSIFGSGLLVFLVAFVRYVPAHAPESR